MDNGASSYLRFLDGDNDGLTDLIREYKDGLILYLNGILKDISTSEEIMQETFVKLVIKRPAFKNNSKFKTWLYAIARNEAFDYIKRNSKSISLMHEDIDFSEEEEDILTSYIREETNIILHNALYKLKDDYRQVLYLSYFEDFKNEEISKIMKIPKRKVENLLYRAKSSLKAILEKEGFTYENM